MASHSYIFTMSDAGSLECKWIFSSWSCCLLGCDAQWSGRSTVVFQRNTLPSSSGTGVHSM